MNISDLPRVTTAAPTALLVIIEAGVGKSIEKQNLGIAGGGSVGNIEGGSAGSTYSAGQIINGGTA